MRAEPRCGPRQASLSRSGSPQGRTSSLWKVSQGGPSSADSILWSPSWAGVGSGPACKSKQLVHRAAGPYEPAALADELSSRGRVLQKHHEVVQQDEPFSSFD